MKLILNLILLLFILISCGKSNDELAKNTLGLVLNKVAGDNQILEDPAVIADKTLKVQLMNNEGTPSANAGISFTLINAESGAAILDSKVTTDAEGFAEAKVKGGDDFGKIAKIKVKVLGTGIETEFTVSVRDKIIPEKIVFVQPSNIVAGELGVINLRLVDRNGRLSFEDEFQTKVRVSFSTGSGNHLNPAKFFPTNSSDQVVTFDKGLASLSGVWGHKAENVTVSLIDEGEVAALEGRLNKTINLSDTKVFKIVPASPIVIRMENPADGTTDDKIPVISKLYDQYDNAATNFTDTCSIDIISAGLDPSIVGTTNPNPKIGKMIVSSGQGQVLVQDTKVETVNLSMANPLNCGAITTGSPATYSSTQDVVFAVGAPAKVSVLPPTPVTETVDNSIPINVQVQDAAGNHVPTYTGSFKATLSGAESYVSTAGVVGNVINLSSGAGTFDVRSKAVESVTVGLQDYAATGIDVTSTQTVSFTVGAAKQFAFGNSTFYGDADNGVDVDVEIWDQYGNKLSAWAGGSVKVVANGSSNANSGLVLSFSPSETQKTIHLTDTVNEIIDLSFADNGSSLLESNDGSVEVPRGRFTAKAEIKWGIIKKLEVLDPTDGTIDSPVTVTVNAIDNWGNIVKDYANADVEIKGNKSSTNSGALNIVNGVATRDISDLINETVDLSLALKTGITELKNTNGDDIVFTSTQDVYFKWGIPKDFLLLDPVDGTVDSAITVTAQVKDQGGNLVKDYTGDVDIAVNKNARHNLYLGPDQQVTLSFNGTTGIVTSDLYDQMAETVDISLVDSAGTGLTLSANQDVVFSPGVVTKYDYVTPAPGTVDTAALINVKALDQFNNHNLTYAQVDAVNVRWVSMGNAQISPNPADLTVDFTGGVAAFNIVDQVKETIRIGLTTRAGIDTSSEVDVIFNAGTVTQIVSLPPAPSGITVDNPAGINLEARDQYGNLNNGYAGDITFLINKSGKIRPTNVDEKVITLASGVATVNVGDDVAEIVTLTLRDDEAPSRGFTLDPVDIEFLPGIVTQYKITDAPSSSVDNYSTVIVQAQDQFGNKNFNHEDDVKLKIGSGTSALTLAAPAANLDPDGIANQIVTIDIANGQGQAYLTDRIVEQAKIFLENVVGQSLTLDPSVSDSHKAVSFVHGAALKYVFTPLASPPTTDGPFTIDLEAQDRWGNKATTFNDSIAVNVNKNAFIAGTSDKVKKVAILNGGGSVDIEDAVVETSVLASLSNALGSNTANIVMTDTLVFDVGFGAPDYFAIIDPVTDGTTDAPYPVSIQIRDKNHNVVTSGFAGTVTFKVSDDSFIGTPGTQSAIVNFANNGNGVEQVSVSNQKTQTITLSLEAIIGQVSNVTDKQLPLEVKDLKFVAGTVTQFELISSTCINVDTDCAVKINAQDQFGNKNLVYAAPNAIAVNFNVGSAAYFVASSDASFSNGESDVAIGDNKAEIVTVSMANKSGGTFTFSNTLPVDFKFGAPAKYKFKNPATAPTTDNPVNVEIQALDQHDNLVTNYGAANQDVTVKINSGGTSVSGVGPVTNFLAGSGVGSINITKTVVGTVVLGLQNLNDSLDVTDTLSLNYAHGAVDKFIFIAAGAPVSVDDTYTLRAEARDQNNNLCTSYGDPSKTVEIFFTANGTTGSGVGSKTFANGFFESVIGNQLAETMTLGFRNAATAGVDVTATTDIIWKAGAPKKFTISALSGPNYTVDDTPVMRVQTKDQYDNVSNTFTGTATIAINKNGYLYDAATPTNRSTKSKTIDFSTGPGGTLDVQIEDFSAESGVQIITSASSDPGITIHNPALINFSHGVAAKYNIDGPDGSVDASVRVDVEVHDRGGNVVQNMASHPVRVKTDSGTTTFSPASGDITLINGVGNIDLSNTKSETVKVEIDNAVGAPTPQTSIAGVEDNIKFDPGMVTQISVSSPATATAGQPVTSVELQAFDQYNNRNNIDGVTYQVELTTKKKGTAVVRSTDNLNLVGGISTSTPTFNTAEEIEFSITNLTPILNGASNPISTISRSTTVIDPSTPTKIEFLAISDDSVDNFITVGMEVQDVYGNKVVSSADQVAEFSLTSASGQALFKPVQTDLISNTFTLKSGGGSFKLYNEVAETVTLGVQLPGGNPPNTTALTLPSDVVVTFTAGAPSKYMIIPPANAKVTDTPSFKVIVQDQYNNKVPTAGSAGTPGRVRINATIPGGSVDVTQTPTTNAGGIDLNIINGEANVTIATQKAGTASLQLTNFGGTDPLSLTPDPTTHPVIFDAGVINKIAIVDPIDDTVDSTGVDVTIRAYDVYDNPTADTGATNVKINVSNSGKVKGTGNLNNKVVGMTGGTATVQLTDQVAETVNISLTHADSSTSGVNITSTQDLLFEPGLVNQVKFDTTALPVNPSVDVSASVTIKAYDQYGNFQGDPVKGSFTNEITVKVSSAGGESYIDGSLGVTQKQLSLTNGVVSFDVNNKINEQTKIEFVSSVSGFTLGTFVTLDWQPGTTKFISMIDPTDATVDDTITVQLKSRDQFCNLTPTYTLNGAVNILTAGSSTDIMVPAENTGVNINNGSGTFTIQNTAVETVNMVMSAAALPGTISSVVNCVSPQGTTFKAAQNVAFAAGAPTKFIFTESTLISGVNVNVDNRVDVEVKAVDQYDNVIVAFNDANRLNITNDSTTETLSGTPISFTNGIGTFSIDETKAGTFNLGMVDTGSITDLDTTQITFDHGAASQFDVVIPSGTFDIDSPLSINVKAQDQHGNLHDDYVGAVTVKTPSSSHPFKPGPNTSYQTGVTANLVSGVGVFQLQSDKAETTVFKVTAADNNAQGGSLTVNQQENITIVPGIIKKLEINQVVSGSVDGIINFKVKALDRANNHATNHSQNGVATITLSGADAVNCRLNKEGETTSLNASTVFDVNLGFGSIDATCKDDDTYTLTLSSAGSLTIKTGGSNGQVTEPIDFTAGILAKVAFISPTPSAEITDNTFTMTVEARDQYNNLVPTYNGKVKIVDKSASSGVIIPSSGNVNFSNGVGSLAGVQVTVSPQSVNFGFNAVSGFNIPDVSATNLVDITHGAASKIDLVNMADKVVGNNAPIKITLQDQFGNTCSSDSSFTVDLILSAGATNLIKVGGPGGANYSGTQNIGISAGEATRQLWSEKAQPVTVSISNPNPNTITIPTSSRTFNYLPDTASKIGFKVATDSTTTDNAYNVLAEVVDQYGNIATTFSSSSIFLTTAAPVSGLIDPTTKLTKNLSSTPISFISGQASFPIQNKNVENITFQFTSGSIATNSLSLGATGLHNQLLLDVQVGAPHHFKLGAAPVGLKADELTPRDISVGSYDQWDNPAVSNDNVTINVNGNAFFGNASNSEVLSFSSSTSEVAKILDRKAETVTISLSAPGGTMVIEGGTKSMTVIHGDPNKVSFVTPIVTSAKTDTPASVELRLYDVYDNLCTTTVGYSVDLASTYKSGLSSAVGGGGSKSFSSGKAIYSLTSSTRQVITMRATPSGTPLATVTNDAQDLSFAWGAPSQIAFTQNSGAAVNGNANIIAEVRDNAGNWLSEHSGTVQFTQNSFSPSGASGGSGNAPSGFGSVVSTNGRFQIGTVTSQQAGTLSVSATQTSGSGSPSSAAANVLFTPGGASRVFMIVQGVNDQGIITSPYAVRILALDNYFNNTTFGGTIDFKIVNATSIPSVNDGYFSPTPGTQTKTVSFSSGEATVNLQKVTTGETKLAVQAFPSGGWSLVNGSGQGEEYYFLPGDPVGFAFLDPGYLGEANFKSGDPCATTSNCHGSTDGSVAVEIHAVDVTGTRSGQYDGSVEVYIKNDPASESAYGGKRVNFVNGRATVTIGNSVAETIQLGVRDVRKADNSADSLAITETSNIKFGAGKVHKITLSDPGTMISGGTRTLQVRAVDISGNVVTSYRGSFELVASANVGGRGTFNIIDGVQDIDLTAQYAGTYTLNLVDPASTGLILESATFIIIPKDPNRIPTDCSEVVTPTDGRLKCWVYSIDNIHNHVNTWVGSVKVAIVDGSNNPVTGAKIWSAPTGGSLLWEADANNDGTFDGNYYIQNWNNNGYHKTFYVSNSKSEIVTIKILDGAHAGLNATGGAASPAINTTSWTPSRFFTPALPTKFEITTPLADTEVGSPATVEVKAFTAAGAVANAYDGYVYVRVVTDPGTASASVSSGQLLHLINGVGSLTISNTEVETLGIALEKVDNTYNGITLIPDKALTQSTNLKFISGAIAKLHIEDPGTGTSGLPLTGTVVLKDASGVTATNNTGSAIIVNIASSSGDIAVTGSPVSIANGSSSATFTLSSNVGATANITASHASYTNHVRAVSFDVGAAISLQHTGAYAVSSSGEITVEVEAVSAQGIRNTNFSQVFGVSIAGAFPGSVTHGPVIAMNSGVGSIVIKSTQAQTVTLSLINYGAPITLPAGQALTYSGGIPSLIRIDTQAIANVLVGDTFEQSIAVSITDGDNVVASSYVDPITVSVFKGANCTDAASGILSGTKTKSATSGSASFIDLNYDVAEEISIKVVSGSFASKCTNVTQVYSPMALTVSPSNTGDIGNTVLLKLTGGVPPISSYSVTTNNSSGSMAANHTCDTNKVCGNYTMGLIGSGVVDTISISDSKGHTETINLTVNGAALALTSGDNNFTGSDLIVDTSETFTFTNNGNSLTGTVSVAFTPTDSYAEDENLMWSVNAVGCTGANLANSQSCNVIVDFLGSTGTGVESTYTGNLVITGANGNVLTTLLTAKRGAKITTSSSSYDMGDVGAGTTKDQLVTFSNLINGTSTGAVSLSLVGGDCGGFSIFTSLGCFNISGGSCMATVRFTADNYPDTADHSCTLRLSGAGIETKNVLMIGNKI